ncbi:unnamed protein product [Didymodactylos carnosus]|uniref:Uncharacterized protein n=1 Tax=Didymodactylos carnosus TaxID=1234261 RepID=A0A814P542_9BILA|nr:unnamed protein product [Didymodactylos carnosus]CAF1100055.1 unnamed protein product [Didymodactylos carnosus]CAF3663709.1 unnamed protein product [Didymodactylos carnosus]CAF3865058.1 unnamed protein product [Didymodactylos carnosus]
MGLESDAITMSIPPIIGSKFGRFDSIDTPAISSNSRPTISLVVPPYSNAGHEPFTNITEKTHQDFIPITNEHNRQIPRPSATRTIDDHTQDFPDLVSDSLSQKCAVVDVHNTTALRYDTSITGFIIQTPADINLIFNYVEHGNYDAIQKVLNSHYKEAVQMRNDRNQTLLHAAVIYSFQYVSLRLLLMRGADPCAQDKDGYTPAHYAVERDDVEMLKALIVRLHAKVKAFSDREVSKIHERCQEALIIRENRGGMTPFMLACFKQAINCARYIHNMGIDHVMRLDKHGDTSLHYAVARSDMAMTKFLIVECKVDVNGGDEKRPSPLDISIFNECSEIKELLIDNNAKSRCLLKRIVQKRKDIQNDIGVRLEGLTLANAPPISTPTLTSMSSLSLENDNPAPKKVKSA